MKVYADLSQLPLAEAQEKLPVFSLPEKTPLKLDDTLVIGGSPESGEVPYGRQKNA